MARRLSLALAGPTDHGPACDVATELGDPSLWEASEMTDNLKGIQPASSPSR
jgi:hypothetical protein